MSTGQQQQQLLSLSFTLTMLVAAASIFPILLVQVAVSEATLGATVLYLERITFSHQSIDMRSIRAHDHLRHSWMSSQQSTGGRGVVEFPLEGLFDPYIFG